MLTDRAKLPRLAADIGGTNARFALFFDDRCELSNERTLGCGNYAGPVAAIEAYLQDTGAPRPREIAMAVATQVSRDEVKLTNSHWTFSVEAARRALSVDRLLMLNDFTALALSLPHLKSQELHKIGTGTAAANAAVGLIGAGTGLGVSGLIPTRDGWVPLEGEGGHVTFSPANEREADILKIVWREFPHVSTERLISGIGLNSLYRAMALLENKSGSAPTPAEISDRALSGSDAFCADVLNTFCAMLATAASNLAVTLGARGGIYIGGGIVPKLGDFFDRSPFRERFESKGRFSDYLAAIPTCVILAEYPALVGAARALLRT
ncbi:MAG: glucokinase [Burkholderiales bacterium]